MNIEAIYEAAELLNEMNEYDEIYESLEEFVENLDYDVRTELFFILEGYDD